MPVVRDGSEVGSAYHTKPKTALRLVLVRTGPHWPLMPVSSVTELAKALQESTLDSPHGRYLFNTHQDLLEEVAWEELRRSKLVDLVLDSITDDEVTVCPSSDGLSQSITDTFSAGRHRSLPLQCFWLVQRW